VPRSNGPATAGTITTKSPGQDVFAYEPPKGFTKVETFATEADQPGGLVTKLVGQPAPDFTLMVYDGPGKTKTLSKADLAGKVVMIDFWATWCGPCMVELPEVQKMIEEYAKSGKDVLIVDTAGRLHVDEKLMEELVKIRKAVKPTTVLLVVDAMTGQDAVNVAEEFGKAVAFDGVIMSKLDGDARGGAALSVKAITGQPILFASTGERSERILNRL